MMGRLTSPLGDLFPICLCRGTWSKEMTAGGVVQRASQAKPTREKRAGSGRCMETLQSIVHPIAPENVTLPSFKVVFILGFMLKAWSGDWVQTGGFLACISDWNLSFVLFLNVYYVITSLGANDRSCELQTALGMNLTSIPKAITTTNVERQNETCHVTLTLCTQEITWS